MTRKEIRQLVAYKQEAVETLQTEIKSLTRMYLLMSDEEMQFVEEIADYPKRKGQRKEHPLQGKSVGTVHWVDEIRDSDTDTPIKLERSQIVRIDGNWCKPY